MVFRTNRPELGFTLIELLVVVFTMAILTGIMGFNFREQRIQQEALASSQNVISKIREVQNFVLTGREVSSGVVADAYELVLSSNGAGFTLNYIIINSDSSETVNFLETVNLSQNMEISQVYYGDAARSQIKIRINAPFANILIDNTANQNGRIDLRYKNTSTIRSVIIDGISGRIGIK